MNLFSFPLYISVKHICDRRKLLATMHLLFDLVLVPFVFSLSFEKAVLNPHFTQTILVGLWLLRETISCCVEHERFSLIIQSDMSIWWADLVIHLCEAMLVEGGRGSALFIEIEYAQLKLLILLVCFPLRVDYAWWWSIWCSDSIKVSGMCDW